MSSESGFDFGDDEKSDREREDDFRRLIRSTFEPWTKSEQYFDHPDAPEKHPGSADRPPQQDHKNDGANIYRQFGLEPLNKFLIRAVRMDHPVAEHPKALAHFLTHIKDWEQWELDEDDPEFGDIPAKRRQLFEWYLACDVEDPDEREAAKEKRTERLRPGGTGLLLHGEQGVTKTTAMIWIVANIMEVNQEENVLWFSTLDDTEWITFAPWATVCLPSGVDVRVTANPHSREYRDLGAFEIDMDYICRQVIRYDDPRDLLSTLADRRPGQFYVVYPDPHFRRCQALTGYSYDSIWDVNNSEEATKLHHFWFGLSEELYHGSEYNYWTTMVGDEAHKWLRSGKGNDEHDWWDKIDDWATNYGDARKKRVSFLGSIHKWNKVNRMVKDMIRWGGTMNGEDFPSEAPLSGKNKGDQGLGDFVIWNNLEWNHVGYPNLKKGFSVSGDIEVVYPRFEAEKLAKS